MANQPQTIISVNGTPVVADQVTKPTDRTFRGAWQLDGPVIEVDMTKARDIYREKLRPLRDAELAKLDADFMKALETGDLAAQETIAASKQQLRDAPNDPAIEAAQTPDELKNLTVAGLSIQ